MVKTDRERRANEPIAIARLQTPLEDQPAKLETMKIHLSWAEQAERQGEHTHTHTCAHTFQVLTGFMSGGSRVTFSQRKILAALLKG